MFDRDKMRMLRLEKRITQTQLAEAVGISQSFLNNFEVGRYVPSLKHMEKIAEALGCSAKDLIKEDQQWPTNNDVKPKRQKKERKNPLIVYPY